MIIYDSVTLLSSSLHWLYLLCRFRLVHLEYCRYASVCDAVRSRGTRESSSPSSPAVQKTYLEMREQRQTERSTQSYRNERYGSFTGTETHTFHHFHVNDLTRDTFSPW